MPKQAPLPFLALGDSYTIGESAPPAGRWPVQLAALLRAEGLPVEEPLIIAHTGWTTADLAEGLRRAAPAPGYPLVSLLIGVNNQFRSRSLEEYRQEFTALLSQAIALAQNDPQRVLVLSIPDWGVTPFAAGRDAAAIGREIDAFNTANRAESERAAVHYVDVTPVSRLAAADPSLIAPDGLHPSAAMYARWAALALPAARVALNRHIFVCENP